MLCLEDIPDVLILVGRHGVQYKHCCFIEKRIGAPTVAFFSPLRHHISVHHNLPLKITILMEKTL